MAAEKMTSEIEHLADSGAGGFNFAGFGPAVSGSKRWGEWTGTIGLQYQATDDLMTYAKYSKGYRSGGWNGRNNTQTSIGFDWTRRAARTPSRSLAGTCRTGWGTRPRSSFRGCSPSGPPARAASGASP